MSTSKSDPCLYPGQYLRMSFDSFPPSPMVAFQDVDRDSSPPACSHGSHIPVDCEDSSETGSLFPPFSPIASSSITSYDWDDLGSVRTESVYMASPAPSVYSLTSSLREQSFRREYGRKINNYSDIYRLPADEDEIARLDRQHRMLSIMMGPWVPPLPEVLAPEPGVNKTVLDLGCGTGAWIADVARAFPECSAIGVDLVPVQAMSMPPNCRYEVDDINLGLEHFYNSFNVVNARLISTGIKDYAGLIDHIARCLRPRGLIVLSEVEYRLYNPDKTLCAPWSRSHPVAEEPYLCRWFFALANAVRQRGGHIDAAALLHLWVRQHHSFAKEDIVHEEYWCPTGHNDDWGDFGPYSRDVAEMMRDDFSSFLLSGRPLLLGSGMQVMDVDHLQTNAQRELDELKDPMIIRVHRVYARKVPSDSV